MNKRVLLGVLTIAVTAALAGIGTWALFSDTASSAGNQFTAGTMNLQVNGAEELDSLHFGDVYPGWSETVDYTVTNDGDVQGRLELDSMNATETGGAHPSAEQAVDPDNDGDLADNVTVTATAGGVEVFSGTLAEFVDADPTDLGIMAGGDEADVELTFSVDSTVGNEIQGDDVVFDLGFTLTSVPAN